MVCLSIDGPNHDLYRKGIQLEKILSLLEILKKQYSEYYNNYFTFSITLTPPIRLIDYANFFNKSIFNDKSMNISVVKIDINNPWFSQFNMETEIANFNNQLWDLLKNYVESENRLSLTFEHNLFFPVLTKIHNRFIGQETKHFMHGCCVPGESRIFIESNGNEWMCERTFGYGQLGNIHKTIEYEQTKDKICKEMKNLLYTRCTKCWLNRLCDLCYAEICKNGKLDVNLLAKSCNGKKQYYDKLINAYLCIREQNSDFFTKVDKK